MLYNYYTFLLLKVFLFTFYHSISPCFPHLGEVCFFYSNHRVQANLRQFFKEFTPPASWIHPFVKVIRACWSLEPHLRLHPRPLWGNWCWMGGLEVIMPGSSGEIECKISVPFFSPPQKKLYQFWQTFFYVSRRYRQIREINTCIIVSVKNRDDVGL